MPRTAQLVETTNPWESLPNSFDRTDEIPDIMEFVLSDKYLDRPNIYPRQATFLKIMFLQDETFTEYDHEVIGQWINSFIETEDNGIQPDVYERIRLNKEAGRRWFRETLAVWGRRGSKGYIGGLAGAYVLWHYLMKGDPQDHYGVDRDKQLACFVFGAKKELAIANQWGDLTNVILGAPCYSKYISKPLGESLSVYAPHDLDRIKERKSRGVYGQATDMASFIIQAKESTKTAGRGPAGFMQFYDEMAHAVKGVAKSDIGEVYDAATPALDQFGKDGFIYCPSSPWAMTGKFYEEYQRSLAHNEDGTPTNPQILMAQLTSWDIYQDWERAPYVAPVPHVESKPRSFSYCRHFKDLKGPMSAYTDDLALEEAANPETFAVERRAHFATVMDAYLSSDRVDQMFEDFVTYEGDDKTPVLRHLTMKDRGSLGILYKAHGDPSKSGANFGWAIAHREGPDAAGMYHVVFDKITHWEPKDFPENKNEIDYIKLEEHFKMDILGFVPSELSFDQFNSIYTMQNLREFVRVKHLPRRVDIFERTSTAPMNWSVAETFKTALGMGLVHAPYYEQASKELKFLQLAAPNRVDHPTSGPVQTKDVADCLMILTHALIGEQVAAFIGANLSNLVPGGTASGGLPLSNQEVDTHNALSRFGRRRQMSEGGRGGHGPSRQGAPTGTPARRRFRQPG